MEPTLGTEGCFICFEVTGKHYFVPSDAEAKFFSSCNTYLHSTITKETPRDIQLKNENRWPLCKRCFDSASELTQLSEQLTSILKDISDLSAVFSMAVFHRRSQAYTLSQTECSSQSFNLSSIIEFNEACLPPNVFSAKNTNQNNINNEIIIDTFQSDSDITNVKLENSDLQYEYDDFSGSSQAFDTNETSEIQINTNEENIDKHCRQHTIEQNKNASAREIRIVREADRNVSKNCADRKKGIQSIMSKSDESVIPPTIRFESVPDIKFDVPNGETSVENSFRTHVEPDQKLPVEDLLEDEELSGRTYAQNISGVKKLKCLHCEKTFAKERQRNNHHATHAGDTPYKCSFCEKKFARRSKQKSHEKSHGINKPINYSLCEKSFRTKATLNIHQRNHKAKKGFQGSLCQESCSQLTDRKVHKRIHTEEKAFKEDFGSLRSLKFHEESHAGVEKPYKCSYCERRCPSPSILRVHERTHTGEKPFECSICEKKLATKNSLQDHEKVHTGEKPFECSFCKKRFAYKTGLKSHERIHTGEKPYKCSICQKSISTMDALKNHERIHTGEKPFECSYCGKAFSQCCNKKTHEKIHQKQLTR